MRDSAACLFIVALSLESSAIAACRAGSTTISPVAPSIAAPSSPTFTLTGRVTDAVSGIPVGGVLVYVNPTTLPPGGFWPQPTLKSVLSDADGNYRVSGLPDWGVAAWVSADKTGYVEPCAAPTITLRGDTTLDLELVS